MSCPVQLLFFRVLRVPAPRAAARGLGVEFVVRLLQGDLISLLLIQTSLQFLPQTKKKKKIFTCVKWTLNSDHKSLLCLQLQIAATARRIVFPHPHARSRGRHDSSWRSLGSSLLYASQSSTGVPITLSEVSSPVHGICSTELPSGGTVIWWLHVHLPACTVPVSMWYFSPHLHGLMFASAFWFIAWRPLPPAMSPPRRA